MILVKSCLHFKYVEIKITVVDIVRCLFFSYFTKLGVDFHILQNMNLSGTISIVLLQNIDVDQLNLLFFF